MIVMIWFNIRELDEPSGCEADIWRVCANHDEVKRNHGIISVQKISNMVGGALGSAILWLWKVL